MKRATPLLLVFAIGGLLALSLAPLVFAGPYSGSGGVPLVSLVHTATNANTYYNYTVLNEDPIFNDPNAEVFVTASWNPNNACGCVYDTHALMVWYFGNTWVILREDGTPLSLGTTYNVFATYAHHYNSPQEASFVHVATAGNITSDWTTLDDPTLNNNPNALIMVTQNWTPAGQQGGVFNVNQVGVWYTGGRWAIFNEDLSSMPVGAAFNVYVESAPQPWMFTQRATSTSYIDDVDNSRTNYQPGSLLFVTPNYNPGHSCPCQLDSHPLGVYYDFYRHWSVYHQDIASMTVGEAFNVIAL